MPGSARDETALDFTQRKSASDATQRNINKVSMTVLITIGLVMIMMMMKPVIMIFAKKV